VKSCDCVDVVAVVNTQHPLLERVSHELVASPFFWDHNDNSAVIVHAGIAAVKSHEECVQRVIFAICSNLCLHVLDALLKGFLGWHV